MIFSWRIQTKEAEEGSEQLWIDFPGSQMVH